jgi:hypothetical protein
MTGIEPTAIAGAAAKAIGKAAEEDPNEKEQLRRLAEQSGALEPAAQAFAKRMVVRQHIRLKLLQPLARLVGVPSEYFATQFENELADKLADVPEEDLVTPPMNVAGPSVQGIAFTEELPNLREMYLNLLATASDRRIQQAAHPSFAEIIRQLGAEEAGWLASVLNGGQEALVEIRRSAATVEEPTREGYRRLATNVLDWVDADGTHIWRPEFTVYVDNWKRLGLVTTYSTSYLTHPDAYTWVETSPLYQAFQSQHDTDELKVVSFEKGILAATEFGRSFFNVVIARPSSQAEETGTDPATP